MESNMQDKKQQAVPQPKAESFAIKRNTVRTIDPFRNEMT